MWLRFKYEIKKNWFGFWSLKNYKNKNKNNKIEKKSEIDFNNKTKRIKLK